MKLCVYILNMHSQINSCSNRAGLPGHLQHAFPCKCPVNDKPAHFGVRYINAFQTRAHGHTSTRTQVVPQPAGEVHTSMHTHHERALSRGLGGANPIAARPEHEGTPPRTERLCAPAAYNIHE